jgi:hypothetical protein
MKNETLAWADSARLILYHVQGTSARTLFLRHASGSVIAPVPLPFLSTLLDEEEFDPEDAAMIAHPAALVRGYCFHAGLEPGLLQPEAEFQHHVDAPGGTITVYLARFTCIDPPRALFAPQGGKFCAITELRGGNPAEMALLQLAYESIMG